MGLFGRPAMKGKGRKIGNDSKVLLLLLVIVAFLTGIGHYSYFSKQMVMIYLYSNDYKEGQAVESSMFSTYSIPLDLYNAMNGTGNHYAGAEEIRERINEGDVLLVDVAKFTPVMANQFVAGGGTPVEMRLQDQKVSVELSADRVNGLGAELRIGSRINVTTSYTVEQKKYTDLIFQNLLVVDLKKSEDGSILRAYVEVDAEESMELLHAVAFELVQVEIVKPHAYEAVPEERASFVRSYEEESKDEEVRAFYMEGTDSPVQ